MHHYCEKSIQDCYCAEGFIRDYDGGPCIKLADCIRPTCPGKNEVYTCDCPDEICGKPYEGCYRCNEGCYCEVGFMRDFKGGSCIPNYECLTTTAETTVEATTTETTTTS